MYDSRMRTTASIRDLRTRFPHLKDLIEREGEVIVTDHGRPAYVLRRYQAPAGPPPPIDYLARLKRRMPKPMTDAATRALDDANRQER